MAAIGDRRNYLPDVLTLTIIDSLSTIDDIITADSKVLYCVRSQRANLTHPDIVSVPTQRIPHEIASSLLDKADLTGMSDRTRMYQGPTLSSESENGHNPLIYCVESLLSRKLGLADYLERDEIKFRAQLSGTHDGVAEYPNLDTNEELCMINVIVRIDEGAEFFPDQTGSYNKSGWVKASDFMRMWDSGKDATLVGLSPLEALNVCVDGLCILSTYDVLSAKLSKKN